MAPGIAGCHNQQIMRLIFVTSILILVKRVNKVKFDVHHWLFFAWLLWAAIGSILSDYTAYSFYGFYPYRGDGLLTWMIITCVAFCYWMCFNTLRTLALTCLVLILALSVGYYFIVKRSLIDIHYSHVFFNAAFLPEVGIASFSSLASIVMLDIFPLLPIIALIPIIECNTRSAFISWLAIIPIYCGIYCWKKYTFSLLHVVAMAIVLLLIAPSAILFSGIEQKLTKLPDFTKKELGARPQWLMQAYDLSQALPLTGLGFDTQQEYLDDPKGGGFDDLSRFIPDRVHNIAYDIILTTGWIGYTLLLLAFGYGLAITLKIPSKHNTICLCTLIAYGIFGCLNPHGLLGNALAITCLFGIRRNNATV
jgi:hypothetical protein